MGRYVNTAVAYLLRLIFKKINSKYDHCNFSRTWICHFGGLRNISAQCVANDENWGQKEGTWHCISTNVFRETPRIQLLPTCSPKYLGVYSFLFGLSFNWWNLLGLKDHVFFGLLHWKPKIQNSWILSGIT